MKLCNRVPHPPRDLNVQSFVEARAPELESLHALVAKHVGNDYTEPRWKRRRTSSHDTRIAKKGRRGKRQKLDGSGGAGVGREKGGKMEKMSRRMRRRLEFKYNESFGFQISGDGTKRLKTHLWHVKRFTMEKKWGFYIPLGLHGSGRGSRAILKCMKNGAVVHDASYYSPVQLKGPKDSLLAVMKMVLVLSPSDVQEEASRQIVNGIRHGSALLYHVGAPSSQFIAPVNYMWRPSSKDHADIEMETDNYSNVSVMQERCETNTSTCQLWVWIHAASLSEGLAALQSACSKQANETGVSVNCLSLEGQFANFEVMGFKAIRSLQKVLHPLPESHNPTHFTTSHVKKSAILEHVEHIPCHSVVSLKVHDPRGLHSDDLGNLHYSHPSKFDASKVTDQIGCLEHCALDESKETDPMSCLKSCVLNETKETKETNKISCFEPCAPGESKETDQMSCLESCALGGAKDADQITCLEPCALNATKETVVRLWTKPEQNGATLADNEMLWVSRDKVNPPKTESILSSENHEKRLKIFNMDSSCVDPSDSSSRDEMAVSCPVLLVKHGNQTFTWWSIILPLNWAQTFWVPLISSGARAIGLRERRWVACDNGFPSFPFDFPDCNAYSMDMLSEAAAFDQKAKLRPLSKRPIRVPIPPPWNCLKYSVKEEAEVSGDTQIEKLELCGKHFSSICSVSNLEQDDCSTFSYGSGLPSIGYVARTRDDIQIPRHENLCFVSVLLHAYKEGVFEEGSVVCAPIANDISLWTSRSYDKDRLQIPQSYVKTYFTEKATHGGEWELKVPDKLEIRQSYNHRWPIGFVTSGCVYGSSRPVSRALCGASFLAQLRKQQLLQQNEMQEKNRSKIFVLVRNLKSASYRLAFATVVLEQLEDDIDFI